MRAKKGVILRTGGNIHIENMEKVSARFSKQFEFWTSNYFCLAQ